MLKDLKVLNGNLELKFHEYTYEYTVEVEEDINSLDLSYELDTDCYLNIRNNNLNNAENIVYLDVYNIDNSITYTLYVYKKTTNTVLGIDNYKKSLDISVPEEVEVYKVQLLCLGVFLLIVIIFSILFRRKRS